MIKGITRQAVVVRSPDPKVFEQAIFLVRDDVLAEGEITEKALLEEAGKACAAQSGRSGRLLQLLWGLSGAALTGLIWLVSELLF